MSPVKEHSNTCKSSDDKLSWRQGGVKRMMALSDDDGIARQPAVSICVKEPQGSDGCPWNLSCL